MLLTKEGRALEEAIPRGAGPSLVRNGELNGEDKHEDKHENEHEHDPDHNHNHNHEHKDAGLKCKPKSEPKPGRRARVMYLDLDLHYGDGVAQAFLSPTHYPSPLPPGRKPPRPPQVLTLSMHHSSPIFFPPTTPHSGLPSPDTPNPFTLSIPLAAYPSASTYAGVFPSVNAIREAYRPDYVVLQLGADGLPHDRVGQYGAWSVDGPGGMLWVVDKVIAWGVPMIVLGGGGYNHPNTARAWARVTAKLVSCRVETPSKC
jgi:histone deacetylase 1/2/histone deacetylase 8